MDAPVDILYLMITGTSILLVYRYAAPTLELFSKKGLLTLILSKPLQFGSVILWLFFIATYRSISIILVIIVSIWLMVAYFIKIPPFKLALTKNRYVKPLVTGIVFSLITTAIPLLISLQYSRQEIFYITAGNMCFVTSLALLFDIFELYYSSSGANAVKVRAYKRTAAGLLFTAGMISVISASSFIISINAFLSLGITYGFTTLLVVFAAPQRNTKFYHLLADSMMALPWVLLQIT